MESSENEATPATATANATPITPAAPMTSHIVVQASMMKRDKCSSQATMKPARPPPCQAANSQKPPPLPPPPPQQQQQQQQQPQHHHHHQQQKPHQQQKRPAPGSYPNYYYTSFSQFDWSQQWYLFKHQLLERVEEPQYQRRLILIIVCCALLLDNMLYMVIVPIIPDYLRNIGAWSTYTENAKWIRSNASSTGGYGEGNGTSGSRLGGLSNLQRHHPAHHQEVTWERIGGQIVYEGEDSAVGFLFASKAIVQLVINPFSGAIIDRIGYEIPMMFGLGVMFSSTMVFACGQTYSVLFLARSLQGVGSAFADTSGLAMIADRFTEENERQRALGIALAFISFGCLVAPPFGSVLYQVAGKEVPFIILSLVCLLDGSLLLLVTPPGTFSSLWPALLSQPTPAAAATATSSPGVIRPPPVKHRIPQQETPLATTERSQHGSHQMASGAGATQANNNNNHLDQDQVSSPMSDHERADQRRAALQRQKSVSRRQSMKVASVSGEAPKGTPIYVLFRDPCIACCSGALVVANVSLAFLEPTISIWVQNTMPDIEEWQMGMIWLPAFVPHVLGVYCTVKLAYKYPRYQWVLAAIGLILEGVSCLMVPFCTSFWSLIMPISLICFGLALIDTAILPTLGYLVDTRYVSVYGSIYAIADISYSLSYAIGPIIAGGIVEAIGFTALNFLIALVTLGYTPILMMLHNIHDYEPFEEGSAGSGAGGQSEDKYRKKLGINQADADELAPFGKFGRKPVEREPDKYSSVSSSSVGGGGGGGIVAAAPIRPRAPTSTNKRQHSVKIVEQQQPSTQQQQQMTKYYQWSDEEEAAVEEERNGDNDVDDDDDRMRARGTTSDTVTYQQGEKNFTAPTTTTKNPFYGFE